MPDDRTIVVERFRDEIGDWRVCILSPFGTPVHAPWAMAIERRLADTYDMPVESMWSDDGIVLRLPEAADELPLDALLIEPDAIDELVVAALPQTALFSARFRECAGRALLLPRRRPDRRTPLWQQRQRAADLLAVASRYPTFPILLETSRECLQDVFDVPALREVLGQLRVASDPRGHRRHQQGEPDGVEPAVQLDRGVHVRRRRTARRTPCRGAGARSRPAARPARRGGAARAARPGRARRRRAPAPAPERGASGALRRRAARRAAARSATCRPPRPTCAAPSPPPSGSTHSSPPSVRSRCRSQGRSATSPQRMPHGCVTRSGARSRSGCRWRSPNRSPDHWRSCAGGTPRPTARSWRPTSPSGSAMPVERIAGALAALEADGRIVRGEFRPEGVSREYCDADVLRQLRRRSLAALRREVEPVEPAALGRFLPAWHGMPAKRRGLDALVEALGPLSGAALPASSIDTLILPARVRDYRPTLLDELCTAGEVVWVGAGAVGANDGRVRLCFADQLDLLAPGWERPEPPEGPLHDALRAHLTHSGASFWQPAACCGSGRHRSRAARGAVGPGVGGGGHQRLAHRAAHRGRRRQGPLRRGRQVGRPPRWSPGRRSAATGTAHPHRAACGPGSMEPGRTVARTTPEPDRGRPRSGAAARRALRRGHPRSSARRGGRRRVHLGVRRAEGARRARPGPPGLLRRRSRRRGVRERRCRRSAPRRPRQRRRHRARGDGGRPRARLDRSGPALRSRAGLARDRWATGAVGVVARGARRGRAARVVRPSRPPPGHVPGNA